MSLGSWQLPCLPRIAASPQFPRFPHNGIELVRNGPSIASLAFRGRQANRKLLSFPCC